MYLLVLAPKLVIQLPRVYVVWCATSSSLL
eukprot:COSAG02_NODE_42724_length_382_cov_0.416961_1_plen_29_part_01